jgi:hypothetical protein
MSVCSIDDCASRRPCAHANPELVVAIVLPTPGKDHFVVGSGETDFAGVNGVDALATQQLGRSPGDALIEEPHDAVGRSAFSSPTIAAA